MKALDKVFDTQVITGIIGDKFPHFIEAKRNLYEEGKKTGQERRYQSYTVTEENPTEFYQKSKWGTLNDVSSYKLYDSIDFENLTGKFWLNIRYYNSKELSLKSRWN